MEYRFEGIHQDAGYTPAAGILRERTEAVVKIIETSGVANGLMSWRSAHSLCCPARPNCV